MQGKFNVKSEFDREKLGKILDILRQNLEHEVNAKDIGATSMTPLKAIVVRETLLWRIVELADGVILCLDAGNSLGAIILARASMECAAVHHQLNRTIRIAKDKSSADVDAAIMRLLLGTRSFSTGNPVVDEKLQMPSILTCFKHLDKHFDGVSKHYEHLCEYAHPNYAGTAGIFSTGDANTGIRSLKRYPDATEQSLLDEALSSTVCAVSIFINDYGSIVCHLPDFFEACDRP